MTCEVYGDDLVLDYVLGSLGPEARGKFEAHLEECEACRAAVSEIGAVARLREAPEVEPSPETDAKIAGIIRRVAAQGKPKRRPSTARRTRRLRPASRVWPVWVAAAAAVLLVAILAMLARPPEEVPPPKSVAGAEKEKPDKPDNPDTPVIVDKPEPEKPEPEVPDEPGKPVIVDKSEPDKPEPEAPVEPEKPVLVEKPAPEDPGSTKVEKPKPDAALLAAATGQVTVVRGSSKVRITPNLPLEPGDVIRTRGDSAAAIAYANEETRLTLGSRAELHVGGFEKGKLFKLKEGTLSAVVAPQPAGRAMEIEGPHATATVLGTRFMLSVTDDFDRLEVAEGRVRFTRRGGEAVEVGPNQYAKACPEGPFAARPMWKVRYPEDGLEAWRPLCGKWEIEKGILVGEGADDTGIMLQAHDAYVDMEIRCEVRVAGEQPAFLSLRNGTRTVMIPPGRNGGWLDLRIEMHGRKINATLDGRGAAVRVKPGGEAELAGLVAFTGGRGVRVEIRQVALGVRHNDVQLVEAEESFEVAKNVSNQARKGSQDFASGSTTNFVDFQPGDLIDIKFTVPRTGRYALRLRQRTGVQVEPDNQLGAYSYWIDGVQVKKTVLDKSTLSDIDTEGMTYWGTVAFPLVRLREGEHTLRVTLTASTYGKIDYLTVSPAR